MHALPRRLTLWMSKTLHRLAHGEGRASDADYLVKIADNIPGGRTICAFLDILLLAGAKFCREIQRRICREGQGR